MLSGYLFPQVITLSRFHCLFVFFLVNFNYVFVYSAILLKAMFFWINENDKNSY
jgi:hypothetical protein